MSQIIQESDPPLVLIDITPATFLCVVEGGFVRPGFGLTWQCSDDVFSCCSGITPHAHSLIGVTGI